MATNLADVFWFMGLEIEADGNKLDAKKLYTALIQVSTLRCG